MKAYSQYLYQAQAGKNDGWRYALVFVLAWMVPNLIASLIEPWLYNNFKEDSPEIAAGHFIIIFFENILPIILLFFLVLSLHKRPAISLINTAKRINWNKLFIGTLLAFLITFVGFFILISSIEIPENSYSIWGTFSSIFSFDKIKIPLVWSRSFGQISLYLIFAAFMLQGLNQWINRTFLSIFLIACLMIWLPLPEELLAYAMMLFEGGSRSNRDSSQLSPFLYTLTALMLMHIHIRTEGIELVIGFLIGKGIWLLGHSYVIVYGTDHFLMADMGSVFFYAFALITDYAFILLLVYTFVISRIFRFRPMHILWQPIPPPQTHQSLIDEIGKTE